MRPALDLLAQVGPLPAGEVCDLGCGDGAAGPALRARFPQVRLIGLDSSPAMLEAARQAGAYDRLIRADAARWQPEGPLALIFSNAALHWLADHPRLMPRLARLLAPGGTLAVQMPANFAAPSHALLRAIPARLFPDRFAEGPYAPPVLPVAAYRGMLAGFGAVDAWETTYHTPLDPAAEGHPVRHFTQSTAMRPVLDRLSPAEARALIAAYDAALAEAYPPAPDGSVVFPFTRLFFTVTRG